VIIVIALASVGATIVTTAAEATQHAAPPAVAGASRQPTLGVPGAYGSQGRGWGKVKPHTLYNGGDISGLITHIHWTSWGGAETHGKGKNAIIKPHGGYYRRPVTIKLTATKLKVCRSTGKSAYSTLIAQEPGRPGGPERKPFTWSHTLCKKY
jgi:hypothetical protein